MSPVLPRAEMVLKNRHLHGGHDARGVAVARPDLEKLRQQGGRGERKVGLQIKFGGTKDLPHAYLPPPPNPSMPMGCNGLISFFALRKKAGGARQTHIFL